MLNSKKLDLEWNPFNEGWSLMKNILTNMFLSFLSTLTHLSRCCLLIPPFLSVCGGPCCNLLPLMDSDGALYSSQHSHCSLLISIYQSTLPGMSVCLFPILSLPLPFCLYSRLPLIHPDVSTASTSCPPLAYTCSIWTLPSPSPSRRLWGHEHLRSPPYRVDRCNKPGRGEQLPPDLLVWDNQWK